MERTGMIVLLALGLLVAGVIVAPSAAAAGPCNGLIDDHCTYSVNGQSLTCRQWVYGTCIVG